MKKWIAATALAVMSVAAQAGVAFVNGSYVADTGTAADPYELGSISAGSNTMLNATVFGRAGADFEESANFIVAEDLSLYGAANTYTLTIFGFNVFGISDFGVELWNGAVSSGGGFVTSFDGNNTTVFLGTLLAGAYHLDMFGTLDANMGHYSVSLQAMPVPEPSTYALLLAGLCVVGFVARRRREMV